MSIEYTQHSAKSNIVLKSMSKELLNSLIDEIQSGNIDSVESKIAELSEEQLDALFGEAVPYKALGTASPDKIVIGSVSNLREKYLKKLITTSFVGFLFQMKEEFIPEEADLITPLNKSDFEEDEITPKLPQDFNTSILYNEELLSLYNERFPEEPTNVYKEMEDKLSEEDLLNIATKANERFQKLSTPEKVFNAAKYNEALEKAIADQAESDRKVVDRYLKWLFKYSPDKHTQEGGHEINNDPERQAVEELKGTDPDTNNVYEYIPPNDTHCRFNSYHEINYEKMRTATRNIYNIKPDLEHAMIVYDVVDKQSAVDSFIQKYGAGAKYDIVTFPLNKWTFMGPFKENRERVDYYNKNNDIIKSMLEQQEKDAALGEELMKKRVKSKKVKSEKVFGKDSPAFEEYKKLSPSELEGKYNAKIENVDDDHIKITREVDVDTETGEKINFDEEGVPTNALEIPITTINAKTGETSKTRIFSRAEDQ